MEWLWDVVLPPGLTCGARALGWGQAVTEILSHPFILAALGLHAVHRVSPAAVQEDFSLVAACRLLLPWNTGSRLSTVECWLSCPEATQFSSLILVL